MIGGSWWNALRFGYFTLRRGPHVGRDFLMSTNRRFCNASDKILGWSRGYPSYYLLSPTLWSRPSMNGLTTRLMSLYQWRKLPDLISLAVADTCNAHCEFCSFTAMVKTGVTPLATVEWKRVIGQAQDLGCTTLNFVGGEPLLREDLPELIRFVDPDLSQSILFSNGFHLADRARELQRAGLTSVIVALDAALPAAHDRRKGLSGLFPRALQGIEAARREKLLVGLSVVVRPEDLESGDLLQVFELGRELKVNELLLFDAVGPTAQWTPERLESLIELAAATHRRPGYPGVHAYAYSKSARGLGCSGGVSHFYVSPYGEVCPCDFNPDSMGNVRETPLHVLWDRFHERGYAQSSLSGCRCQPRTAPEGARQEA